MTTMHDYISTILTKIEREYDVTILFAIESGSRMWGFESSDSDWDIRFVYRRNDVKGYFSVSPQTLTDHIEYKDPINPLVDCVGWDIDKTINLMYRGNGTIVDWLGSPIVYRRHNEAMAQLIMFQTYLTTSAKIRTGLAYHHRGLTKRAWDTGVKISQSDITRYPIKKFLYALRSSALCIQMAQKIDMPIYTIPSPIFADTIRYISSQYPGLEEESGKLVEKKRMSKENGLFCVGDYPVCHGIVSVVLSYTAFPGTGAFDSDDLRYAADSVLKTLVAA